MARNDQKNKRKIIIQGADFQLHNSTTVRFQGRFRGTRYTRRDKVVRDREQVRGQVYLTLADRRVRDRLIRPPRPLTSI